MHRAANAVNNFFTTDERKGLALFFAPCERLLNKEDHPMPFDATTSDYLKTKPVPVFDRDHAPQTMWDAIRLGVRDLEATERTPGYVINMSVAHEPADNGCHVCFAGAVMAQSLSAQKGRDYYFDSHIWSLEWNRVFRLLDMARRGIIPPGLFREFGVERVGAIVLQDFKYYAKDPTAFKRDMLALADRLEAEGV